MLSEEEKREMLEDGLDLKRREAFTCLQKAVRPSSRSLDEFISYLNGIQTIFSPFSVSKKKIITSINKL